MLTVSWERFDRHRLWTWLAMGGVAVALAMAVFGLPGMDLHGPFHRFGIMDPLCGGTRSARFTMRGEWAEAWRYNPLGLATVMSAALVAARAGVGWGAHRWLTIRLHLTPRTRMIVIAVSMLAVVALEIRQQGRAELLMRPY